MFSFGETRMITPGCVTPKYAFIIRLLRNPWNITAVHRDVSGFISFTSYKTLPLSWCHKQWWLRLNLCSTSAPVHETVKKSAKGWIQGRHAFIDSKTTLLVYDYIHLELNRKYLKRFDRSLIIASLEDMMGGQWMIAWTQLIGVTLTVN